MKRAAPAAAVVLALVLSAAPAGAQWLPVSPITLGDGRATIGGDVSATFAPKDTGYFNLTDYDLSLVRLLQLDVAGSIAAGAHVSVLGVARLQNDDPQAFALYARIRPWTSRAFDVEAGRIPPTFGAFGQRAYTADNPLIGEPLAYQYLTSLRADAVPASADELLRMRGRGWESSYSMGNPAADHGVPLVSAARWDTGVRVSAAGSRVAGMAAVTLGTLSNPLFPDDNSAPQIAGRLVLHAGPSLTIGASAARGAFVASSAADAAGVRDAGRLTQRAFGADVEYSRDYVLIRAETIFSAWTLPSSGAPALASPLGAGAVSLEGRYKLRPGLYAAGRYDHLGFSDITGTTGTDTWDAPVTRIELGGGYLLQRNVVLKLAYQRNWRDGGRVRELGLVMGQLLFWL